MFESILNLPLEQKVGQLLFIGLPGTEVDPATADLLAEVQPGGVCIFGRNVRGVEQIRGLNDGVREKLAIKPLVAIDQEGGLVDRLRRICTPMPAARVIRQHGDIAASRALGRITGEVLRILGFNMNFAPVMEIMTPERDLLSNGLYSRSFGRSPGEVLGYSMVYLRGLQSAGILGCLKHFPGIGAGEVDTHEEIPVINLSQEDLVMQDLSPYIELFGHRQEEDDRIRAVMVSHGGFPKINLDTGSIGGKLYPASISKQIVTKLLRDELGFRHLVLTDDMEMGAIMRYHPVEEAACLAFEAGEDMILICSSSEAVRKSYHALLECFRSGRISTVKLDEALQRIAEVKSIVTDPLPFDAEKFAGLSREIAELNKKLDYSYGGKP
jgi:beta-N-acetylhexosaminidase